MSEFDLFRQFVESWVKTETPSSDPTANLQFLSDLAAQLRRYGWQVESVPGQKTGGSLLAKLTGTVPEKPQLLVGHCDTVWPMGTLAEIPLTWDKERAFGPGIFDMKAGLAMGVMAMLALAERQSFLSTWFFINSDEEIGSPESTEPLKHIAKQCSRAFVLEPAWGEAGALKTERRGAAVLRLQVQGRSAHAGLNPQDGRNAILDLADWLLKCPAYLPKENTFSVGTIRGGSAANVVPEQAHAQVDIRMLNSADLSTFIKAIQAIPTLVADVTRQVEVLFEKPPLTATQQNQALFQQAVNVASNLGQRLQHVKVGGASDGNTTNQYIPTLDGMGAIGGNAHARGEYINVPATLQRLHLLKALLRLS
ncbi:MAG: M20/M25/M40 family metallo-hydrolase [Acidobacteria bacterium]|nr:M20/M25/M40 family metallo-hydrolase [Acidobacteriota bacterium]